MSAAKYQRYTRLMLIGAAAILIVTAALHGTGLPVLERQVTPAELPGIWRDALRAIWILYALHLVLVASILVYAVARPGAVSATVLVLCGLIPALDAIALLLFVGPFPGNALLAIAAVLTFGAAARGTSSVAHGSA
jgi:hypothetical protein